MTRPTADRRAFIEANTEWLAPPHVPEIRLRLASEVYPIWRLTEDSLTEKGIPPPFWAFAWAGGQALARYVLDHPATVAGKRVLDVGSGSGLVAIAAAKAGAARVTASDIDMFAVEAMRLNAAEAGVNIEPTVSNCIGIDSGWGAVLIGDLFYEHPLAMLVEEWARRLVARGALVLIGDPGRAYLPKTGIKELGRYQVPTSRELEDNEIRSTAVFQLL